MVNNPPIELVEYRLCEKFGWTIDELYCQPYDKISKFLIIMSIEALKQKELESSNERN